MMAALAILFLALAGGPLENGSFEQGLTGWSVESNLDSFQAECLYTRPFDGRCSLEAGLRRGVNELVQVVDVPTSGCALSFWYWIENESAVPTQDRYWVSVDGTMVLDLWNGEAKAAGWQKVTAPLPKGQVRIAAGSDIMVWRWALTVGHFDAFEVRCAPALYRLYLPVVGR